MLKSPPASAITGRVPVHHLRAPYAFTDPLGRSDGAPTRRRIRHAHALIYGAAVPSLLLALIVDGGPAAQRAATGGAALTTAAMAAIMLLWTAAPDRLLLAAFPLAAVTVSAIGVLDPPLALTPMYYVWPLLTAAYFLRTREMLATYAAVCASFAAVTVVAIDDGTRVIQWATVVIVGGVVVAFVAILTRHMEDLVRRLGVLAREDPLTGAMNRRALLEHLDGEIARRSRGGGSCAVALMDVDHFKAINDDFGHAAGDAALRGLVFSVSSRLRGGDALGRLGGEEFAVVLAGADREGAEAYAEELRRLVAADAARTGTPFTVSVGVATVDRDGATGQDLLAAADAALYRAKAAGRDTVRSG